MTSPMGRMPMFGSVFMMQMIRQHKHTLKLKKRCMAFLTIKILSMYMLIFQSVDQMARLILLESVRLRCELKEALKTELT